MGSFRDEIRDALGRKQHDSIGLIWFIEAQVRVTKYVQNSTFLKKQFPSRKESRQLDDLAEKVLERLGEIGFAQATHGHPCRDRCRHIRAAPKPTGPWRFPGLKSPVVTFQGFDNRVEKDKLTGAGLPPALEFDQPVQDGAVTSDPRQSDFAPMGCSSEERLAWLLLRCCYAIATAAKPALDSGYEAPALCGWRSLLKP